MKPTLLDAINALSENAEVSVYGDENEDFEVLWLNGTKPVSNEKILEKLKELNADYDAKKYQRERLKEYPTIEELVVALYDESDKASIIERRNAVKAKYPKPE